MNGTDFSLWEFYHVAQNAEESSVGDLIFHVRERAERLQAKASSSFYGFKTSPSQVLKGSASVQETLKPFTQRRPLHASAFVAMLWMYENVRNSDLKVFVSKIMPSSQTPPSRSVYVGLKHDRTHEHRRVASFSYTELQQIVVVQVAREIVSTGWHGSFQKPAACTISTSSTDRIRQDSQKQTVSPKFWKIRFESSLLLIFFPRHCGPQLECCDSRPCKHHVSLGVQHRQGGARWHSTPERVQSALTNVPQALCLAYEASVIACIIPPSPSIVPVVVPSSLGVFSNLVSQLHIDGLYISLAQSSSHKLLIGFGTRPGDPSRSDSSLP